MFSIPAFARRARCGVALAVCGAACAPGDRAGGERARGAAAPAACAPIARPELVLDEEAPDAARALMPAAAVASADTIFYADAALDLDCDGRADLVAQAAVAGRPTLLAYVRVPGADTGWRAVLRSPSPVAGGEYVVLAADLTGGGRRDLVTLGSDEGGLVPRVFAWRAGAYRD